MKKILFLLLIANIFVPKAIAGSPEFERRVQENRRLFEQRAAENRKSFDERVRQMRSSSGSASTQNYGSSTPSYGSGTQTYGSAGRATNALNSAPRSGSFQNSVQPDRMKGTPLHPLPYDAARAPSPGLCFLKFVATARTATNINQLINFLPYSEVAVLKERQQQYDPALAAEHYAAFKRDDPSKSEATLKHLTQDPYSGELQHCREIAANVLRVIKVSSIKGNKALLEIGTRADAVQNGVRFPYGTAKVEMLCEGSYWKFSSYNDEDIFYKKPQ